MILEAGVRRQGGKAEVVIDEQAEREDVGIVLLTLADVGVDLLVSAGQCCIVDNVSVEGLPDFAFVDGAIQGAALTTIFVLDMGLDVEPIGLIGG